MTAAGKPSRILRERESTAVEGAIRGGNRGDDTNSVSADDIQRALHSILDSPEFRSVVQLRSFLNYVVTKTIENRTSEIKGYTIAVEALGRDSSFDPVSDPIVRVEAARLRRRLETYYEGSGKDDPLLIEIPKGSYAPKFTNRVCVSRQSGISLEAENTATSDGFHDEIKSESAFSSLAERAEPMATAPVFLKETQERDLKPSGASYYPPKSRITFDTPLMEPAQTGRADHAQTSTKHLPISQVQAVFILVATFFAGVLTGLIL